MLHRLVHNACSVGAPASMHVFRLGPASGSALAPVDFAAAERAQQYAVEWLLQRRHAGTGPAGLLLLMQLNHVYSFGRRQRSSEPDAVLRRRAQVVVSGRGGLATYHGPGQLVAYPVVDLRRLKLSARCHVHHMEHVMQATCSLFGIDTCVVTGFPGLWVGGEERKIGAVGIHVSRGIAQSGVSLNVDPQLEYFDEIDFCGLGSQGKVSTSIARELAGSHVRVDEVATRFTNAFSSVYHAELIRHRDALVPSSIDRPEWFDTAQNSKD